METTLQSALTGSNGARNRARIVRALVERPRNTNQLSGALDLHYKTVRHHLEKLVELGIVDASGDQYGAVFLPSERVRADSEALQSALGELSQS